MQLAVCCSKEAYDEYTDALNSAYEIHSVLERVRISTRSIGEHERVVVVAVSGTRRVLDWMTNFNGWASEPQGLLVRDLISTHGFWY